MDGWFVRIIVRHNLSILKSKIRKLMFYILRTNTNTKILLLTTVPRNLPHTFHQQLLKLKLVALALHAHL